jgi:hypothetical protein
MALNCPSMLDGATYLPLEVLNRSFLRSVILRKPGVVHLADVAGGEPAVGPERARGLRLQVVVAVHDPRDP